VNILLVVGYWITGFIYACLGCCCIGFLVCAGIALWRVGIRKTNWLLTFVYLLGAGVTAGMMWGGLFLIGWAGDRTHYFGQRFIFGGLIFPGIFALKVIKAYFQVGNKQTLGMKAD
jgi:hypothetical protein